jgi:hypothetical protein
VQEAMLGICSAVGPNCCLGPVHKAILALSPTLLNLIASRTAFLFDSSYCGNAASSDLAMLTRVPQPPVNPALRDPERHEFWPGFIAALIGVVLVFCGARHLTGVDTVEGATAWETQLMKAFSVGGLQFASQLAPPAPPKLEDPTAAAEALDRWAREVASAAPPSWKVRVDTGAKKACPT